MHCSGRAIRSSRARNFRSELDDHPFLPGRGGEDHLGAVGIDEHADVVVAAAVTGLVDADLGHLGEVLPSAAHLHVVHEHPPEPGVLHTHHPGSCLDRHLPHQEHGQRLKEEGEPTPLPRPRHRHLAHAVPIAADPRHPRVQVGLVLEEVQMPPLLVRAVPEPGSRGRGDA